MTELTRSILLRLARRKYLMTLGAKSRVRATLRCSLLE
jgi:hypothetical protein